MPVEQPFDVHREQLSSLYHGLALWKPSPEDLYDQVAIGDVGYISEGAFIRMFNVTLPWDDESNRTLGKPDPYDLLDFGILASRHENFGRVEYYSGVLREENANNVFSASPEQADGVVYRCRGRGALLSLPHGGHREGAIHTKVFEKYIRDHVDSWFNWSRRIGLPVERTEDLVLVYGCTLVTSWAAAAFDDHAAEAQISLTSTALSNGGSSFQWGNIRGIVEYHDSQLESLDPYGPPARKNHCVFVKCFRAKRILFWTRYLRAAAEPLPDDPDNSQDDEIQVTQVPNVSNHDCDPLIGILDYMAEKCLKDDIDKADMAITHHDDLRLVKDVGILTADAVGQFLSENDMPLRFADGAAMLQHPLDKHEESDESLGTSYGAPSSSPSSSGGPSSSVSAATGPTSFTSATETHPSASGTKHRKELSAAPSTSRMTRMKEENREYTAENLAAVERVRACKVTEYYEILAIKKECNDADLKRAYRTLALQLHLSKNGALGADEAFKMVSKAFEVLSDPQKRAMYDRSGGDPEMSSSSLEPSSGRPTSSFGGVVFEGQKSSENFFNMASGKGPAFSAGRVRAASCASFRETVVHTQCARQQEQKPEPATPPSLFIQFLPLLLLFARSRLLRPL